MISATITLPRISCYAYHGVGAQERSVGQLFWVSLRLWLDVEAVVRSDKLADTVDYTQIEALVRSQLQVSWVQLLETLAHRVACSIMHEFQKVKKVRIRITKPMARFEKQAQCATVQFSLKRSDLS